MKRWTTVQHVRGAKHLKNKALLSKQQSLNFEEDTFFGDLCQAFVAADIPLFKLKNPPLCEFLEKYIGRVIPAESTIRASYVNESYKTAMECIRQEIGNSPVWVSIDETMDANGRFIANVIVGKLNSDEAGRPLLLNVAELNKTNHQTIASLFNDSMSPLWPGGVQHSKVLLFVSNGTWYLLSKSITCHLLSSSPAQSRGSNSREI